MKTHKYQPESLSAGETIRRREVQQEIDNYLLALSSYPDRFAQDPCISFEQHLLTMMAAGQTSRRQEADEGLYGQRRHRHDLPAVR